MITFIVPARSGSQRLKDKNIRLLNGKPLIFYTIEALLGHREISRVIFTSDSNSYCDMVKNHFLEKVTVLVRPIETAGNKIKVVDEVERILINHKDLFETKWFGLALPTAPLRDFKTVANTLSFWKENNIPVFTSNEYDFPVQFAFRINKSNQTWESVFENSPMITGQTRSQDIENLYRPNGALYINEDSNFLKSKILYKGALPFIISRYEASDIDTEADFSYVESLLKKNKIVKK